MSGNSNTVIPSSTPPLTSSHSSAEELSAGSQQPSTLMPTGPNPEGEVLPHADTLLKLGAYIQKSVQNIKIFIIWKLRKIFYTFLLFFVERMASDGYLKKELPLLGVCYHFSGM
mgnify:CR=1 FL=1